MLRLTANKLLYLVLIALFVILQYQLWFKRGNVFDAWQLEQQLQTAKAENAVLEARNAALIAEVDELKTGQQALEAHARRDLGMVKKDEHFYQIVHSPKS